MNVTELIDAAFEVSRDQQSSIHKQWISLSHRMVKIAPQPIYQSIQNVGMLDLVLREMERQCLLQHDASLLSHHYQLIFSELWLGSAFEVFRIIKEINPDNLQAREIHDILKLVRIPIEKLQIADDKKLNSPMVLTREGNSNVPELDVIYDKNDPLRSITLPRFLSENGSLIWQVLDVKSKGTASIERLYLSDRILNFQLD